MSQSPWPLTGAEYGLPSALHDASAKEGPTIPLGVYLKNAIIVSKVFVRIGTRARFRIFRIPEQVANKIQKQLQNIERAVEIVENLLGFHNSVIQQQPKPGQYEINGQPAVGQTSPTSTEAPLQARNRSSVSRASICKPDLASQKRVRQHYADLDSLRRLIKMEGLASAIETCWTARVAFGQSRELLKR